MFQSAIVILRRGVVVDPDSFRPQNFGADKITFVNVKKK